MPASQLACPSCAMEQRRLAIVLLGLLVVLLGCVDTESAKLMNAQRAPPCAGCEPVYFEAPFFQAILMDVGEVVTGLYYGVYLVLQLLFCYRGGGARSGDARELLSMSSATTTGSAGADFDFLGEVPEGLSVKKGGTPVGAAAGGDAGGATGGRDGSDLGVRSLEISGGSPTQLSPGGNSYHRAKMANLPPAPFYIWFIPMIVDLTCSVCIYTALLWCPAATVHVIRGLGILITAAVTTVWLGHRLTVQQVLACSLATAGMICSSTVFLATDSSAKAVLVSQKLWGIFFAVCGTVLASGVFATQEWIARNYTFNPMVGMFYTGLHGTVFGAALLVIVHALRIENFAHTTHMIFQNFNTYYHHQSAMLVLGMALTVLSISIYNVAGLTVVQISSGLSCNLIFVTRTISVWIADVLILKYTNFHVIDLVGVLLITSSLFIFDLWSLLEKRLPDAQSTRTAKNVLLYAPFACGAPSSPAAGGAATGRTLKYKNRRRREVGHRAKYNDDDDDDFDADHFQRLPESGWHKV